MAKKSILYVCQECGHEAHKWMGKCPGCGAWNTMVEETPKSQVKARVPKGASKKKSAGSNGSRGGWGANRTTNADIKRLTEIELTEEARLRTGIVEFDRVMGGGIMQGSFSLIAGDPGIGKSTLMTEMGRYLPNHTILYVTGEESKRQVKLRAQRLGVDSENLLLLSETNVEEISSAVEDVEPDILIVDSIQTIYRPDLSSAPGSVSQVRESTASLLKITKELEFSTFLVGHVTKKGTIAGPRVLEHMVDTVLYFEGDRHHAYRILRSVKNRFGAANEIGVFEMRESGLREVQNPSEIFLSERGYGVSGSTVVCSMEGTRPVLVEIQSLVTPSSYGTPQRTATGFEYKRLQMILAVLEKRSGLAFSDYDVFINVAGGVKLDEPAVDLGVAVAAASSFKDVPTDTGSVLIGEVGLGGEIRTVSQVEPRLKEAAKLGFERAVIPQNNLDRITVDLDIDVTGAKTLRDVVDMVL
ncbi:DNA repair protein RadA [Longibacter salinarum]|uniref:DNA repair protein RadA n=1 Tax=Longibacter salinarum TaxID=1850348 RepID=A0A2A8CZY6_9BACT|nr:DNA repair protein RadA [Longibacter salinarum]PEN14216.1 DNA repair protein RadA [Longibacter salinarum]